MKTLSFYILILSFCFSFADSRANGNHALNFSYSISGKGINYVQASGVAATRYYPFSSWPVNLNLSGIPQNARIEKAFLYFVAGFDVSNPTGVTATFVDPLGIPHLLPAAGIGRDSNKGWLPDSVNMTFRVDVTNYMMGNGTYQASCSRGSFSTDGFSLFVVYRDDTAIYYGNIYINDGIITIKDQTLQTTLAISTPDVPSNAKAFIIASDIQENVGGAPKLEVGINSLTFARSFWNFEQMPVAISKNTSSLLYKLERGGDAYAWAMAGVYYQMPDTGVYIRDMFTDTLFCYGEQFFLPYEVSPRFRGNNIFSVLLSDTLGSFANPTVLGTKADSVTGYVSCTIPNGLKPSPNYRMRIVGNSPVDTFGNKDRRVRVSAFPLPPQAAALTPVCQGWPLNLYDFSADTAASYAWLGPTGITATNRYPTIPNMPMSGTGYYVVTKENYSCTSKDSVYVTVIANADKPTVSSNGPLCTGDTLKLWATTATANATFNWLMPSGAYAQGVDGDTMFVNVTQADAGTYKVVAMLNSCVSPLDSTVVTIHQTPYINTSSNSPVCQNGTLELKVTDTVTTSSFLWKGPGGYTSPLAAPIVGSINFAQAGNYVVVATNHQCSDTDTVAVVVKPLPELPAATSNSPVCEGDALQLTAKEISNVTYKWFGARKPLPDDMRETGISPIALGDEGMYYVTANLDGCLATDSTYARVKPLPNKPQLTATTPLYLNQQLVLWITNAQNNVRYLWEGPSGFFSEEVQPKIDSMKPEYAGRYKVTATLDGCITMSDIEVNYLVDDTPTFLRLYPVPNNGTFTVEGKFTSDREIPMIVFDMAGREIYRTSVTTINRRMKETITLPAVAAGGYILRLKSEAETHKFPFIVTH